VWCEEVTCILFTKWEVPLGVLKVSRPYVRKKKSFFLSRANNADKRFNQHAEFPAAQLAGMNAGGVGVRSEHVELRKTH